MITEASAVKLMAWLRSVGLLRTADRTVGASKQAAVAANCYIAKTSTARDYAYLAALSIILEG